MSKFKIEKNIKLPAKVGEVHPFKDMEVGDSFSFKGIKTYNAICKASARYRKANKTFKCTIRKTFIDKDNPENTEYRYWRLKDNDTES